MAALHRFKRSALPAGAFVAVDIFFWLSGLLVAYVLLKKIDKMKTTIFASIIPIIYAERYFRLLPGLLVVLGVYWVVLPNFGFGPMWPYPKQTTEGCDKYW